MPSNLWQGRWQGRVPVGDTHRRAREVISPSGGIVRGKFPSRKNGRMVHHEGLLELEASYLFETSPLIVRYREQPPTIHYPDGARLRKYTPDFELVLASGEVVLIEVKPVRSLQDEEVRHKLDRVAEHMQRSARHFIILTDATIRQEPRLSNLRWIYHRAARVPPSPDAARLAATRNSSHFPLSIKAAAYLLGECGLDPYSLLLAGLALCPLERVATPETLIDLAKEPHDVWFYIAQEHGF
ncbi:MAG: TnsA endonuclease N-terminal domain-containing protein [Pseudomonadota bacterium]